ncbi:tRNA uridine 5-carboxymethylaminomethyl modification enzyme MnmG [Firmicutes bacterium CAG:114]|nr:tRNA uridine 5-carboxymethylaminomethyl modification enzyme MnmG [Firmicutes bacterium CAG:114]
MAATAELNQLLAANGEPPAKNSLRLSDLVRRPRLTYEDLAPLDPDRPALSQAVREQVEISLKYEGYIARQQRQVEEMRRLEGKTLPADLDYHQLAGLRLEARQKLDAIRPGNLGQAARISGVSPADVAALMIALERKNRPGETP